MQINFPNIPQQNVYNTKRVQFQSPRLTPQLQCDTVSFRANKDLLELSDKEIFDRIQTSMSSIKNYLGQGNEARVYKIEGTNYCVRFDNFESLKFDKMQLNRDTTEADKVNHIVAKFGEGSSIMRYIEGSPVLSTDSMFDSKEPKRIAEEIAQMPVKSFNRFLKQICHAYNNDMIFDCCWPNVIINPKNQTITAIDFNKNTENESLKPLSYMFSSLVHPDTTQAQCKIYADKILNAALDEFAPATKPCWNIANFDFSSLLRNLSYKTPLDDVFVNIFKDTLNTIQDLKFQDIKGFDVTKELEANLKVARALIKQIM